MRPPQRKRRLQFEVMESARFSRRAWLALSLAPPTLVIPIPPEPPVPLPSLHGLLSGSYSAHTLPDVGTTYDLSGQGQVQPLGPMTVTGSVHFPGSILRATAAGRSPCPTPKGP